ncbi:unnamed protein product [Periconia digitata]|uniref:NAD(P)-binding protein n=1 Tax=Periconia digitata TaxID=1303443 RepID=A0A9W4XR40_9PLEO|nr:unnamed protein product [Periconia digitata]
MCIVCDVPECGFWLTPHPTPLAPRPPCTHANPHPGYSPLHAYPHHVRKLPPCPTATATVESVDSVPPYYLIVPLSVDDISCPWTLPSFRTSTTYRASLLQQGTHLLISAVDQSHHLQPKQTPPTAIMSTLDAAQLFSVKGLVAVVTGAGSGLGEIMAHALDVNGASKVFILGRREAKLKEAASKAKNGTLIPVACDISSKESLEAAVSAIEKQTPFINVLVANGGFLGEVTNMAPRPAEQTVNELQTELWNKQSFDDAGKVVSTNIAGSYFTFLAFLGLLGAGNTHADSIGKSGYLQSQFISTTSFGGLNRLEPPSYVYNASKAALNHLTKTLSSEFAKHNIRANAIAPGMFVTEMTEVRDGALHLSFR